jgi:hypothetical protein
MGNEPEWPESPAACLTSRTGLAGATSRRSRLGPPLPAAWSPPWPSTLPPAGHEERRRLSLSILSSSSRTRISCAVSDEDVASALAA